MKKVLILSYNFPPLGTVGGSIRLVKAIKYLRELGSDWVPTVVTIDDKKDLLFQSKNSHFSMSEIPHGTKVIRTATNEFAAFPRDNRLNRFFNSIASRILKPASKLLLSPDPVILWRKELMKAVEAELESAQYDAVMAIAPPFSVLEIGKEIKERFNIPLVVDIKDDWIDSTRFSGIKKLHLKREIGAEKAVLAAADKVILVTQKSLDKYSERHPHHASKMCLITNGCDVDEYRPFWSGPITKNQKFTLLHSGVVNDNRDMRPFFNAFKELCDEDDVFAKSVEFVFIGNIPFAQKAEIKRLELENIFVFKDYMSREEYLSTLVECHLPVAINYTIPTLVPGKIYDYWGSRNKILLLDCEHSAAAELMNHYNLGWVASYDDSKAIAKVVKAAFTMWQEGKLPLNSTDGIESFDRKALAKQLSSVFDEVSS